MPLATGIYVHKALETILKMVQKNPSLWYPSLTSTAVDVTREATEASRIEYQAEATRRGFDGEQFEDQAFTIKEQSFLVEALVWGWVRAVLPSVLENFKIIEVETEHLLEMGPGVQLMVRPDYVLERKRDGKLFFRDFKTASTTPNIQEYASSPQMAIGTLAVEKAMGRPVEGYYIDVLLKGQWKGEYAAEMGDYSGPKRQQSLLCYAYKKEANPPLWDEDWQPKWKYRGEDGKNHTLGKLYTKTPIWESKSAEQWTGELHMSLLWELFPTIGPFPRQDLLARQFKDAFYSHEAEWSDKLQTAFVAEEEYGWTDERTQSTLSRLFPRSYNCYGYGSRCPFYDICFRGAGWEDPVGSGKYGQREPHHQPELDQMIERGVV